MAIQGYQSSYAIISKVFRDLRIQETDWVTDAVEWIGEALQAIGSIAQLEDAVKIVKTSSHKVRKPSGLYLLMGIRYGYFNSEEEETPKLEDFPRSLSYEGGKLHPSMIESHNTNTGASTFTEETFFIKGDMIHTSFEEDWVAIVYRKISVDSYGFPKVPDHYSFSQALYWYIVMKMMEGGMEHPSKQITWEIAEDRWLKYCTQARTKALMPDPSKYKEFLNSWVSLIPNMDDSIFNSITIDYEEPSTLAGMAFSPIKDE